MLHIYSLNEFKAPRSIGYSFGMLPVLSEYNYCWPYD